MADSKCPTAQPPGAATLVYTTDPGTLLVGKQQLPYEFTGTVDRAWFDATKIVGRNYTEREIKSGWPKAMEPHRLANLQYPQDSKGQSFIQMALLSACERHLLRCVVFQRVDYGVLVGGALDLRNPDVWTDYAISAIDFSVWLAAQKIEPSSHIAAWFAATGVRQTNEPDQVPGRVLKKDMHPEWPGHRLAERKSELRGTKAPTQKLAAESGLDEREIRRRIEVWNREKTNPLSPARMGNQREKTPNERQSASPKR